MSRRHLSAHLRRWSITLATLTAVAAAAQAAPVTSFALIGDTPYGVAQEPMFDRVIDDINANAHVRFVIHTGDIKAGSERCDDDLFLRRFAQYQRFSMPFVLTPGDNEWTDCHRTSNGNYVPTERLARLREIFYPVPGRTTGGRSAKVNSQAFQAGHEAYVENQMATVGGVTFATLHVVGSNNDLAPWDQIDSTDSVETPRADRIAEYEAREAANLAWIATTFDEAERAGARGVLIAMQADPLFEVDAADASRSGFNAVLDAITARAIAFGKPVVVAHGDSHYFRMDKPLYATDANGVKSLVPNVTRIENFGSQDVHWVEIVVDPKDENVFSVRPHIVQGNAATF